MFVLTRELVKVAFLSKHESSLAFLQLTRLQDTRQLIKWEEGTPQLCEALADSLA